MTIAASDALQALQNENKKLKEEISYLKEQLQWFLRQHYGKRSEKIVADLNNAQLSFAGFDHPEKPEEKTEIPAHLRKTSKHKEVDKVTLPPDIPVEKHVLDLSEEEKVCKVTGQALVKIGEEITQKLCFKPGSYFIKQIIRPKYAIPGNSDAGIQIAALPCSLLNRCQADESLLADILTKKFVDHLPLYRITEMLSREGIGISRQLLSQWVLRCGSALKPLYEEMKRQIFQSENIFADETPINMQDPGKGKVQQAYMWVLVGGKAADPPYRIYHFRTNRNHINAAEILKGYKGVLHSDKYGAYEALANAKQLTWCPCWSHIRRKFFEAESGDIVFRRWVLRKIRYLFMLERVAWARSEEERLKIRQEKEKPIIDELIETIKVKMLDGKILPKSKYREALGYFCGLIPYLKNYLYYPYARLDNNVAERAVRPLAIGRKNWLFVGSEEGGIAAAVILSLVQSCRAIGINPREYLEDIMRRLLSHRANKVYELLPAHWHKSR